MTTQIEKIGNATLYLGDCMDILPTLDKVDAVITDPPYGIGIDYQGYEDTPANLQNLIDFFVPWSISNAKRTIVLCGISQIHEYPKPTWIACIAWDTTGSFGKCGYTQWMPVLVYGADVFGFGNVEGIVIKSDLYNVRSGSVGFLRKEKINHPCPKSLSIMNWSISRFSLTNESILDPFMGSGTTGVACAQLGRSFIGIEREPAYFDVACRRIEQAYKQGQLFEHEPIIKQIQGDLL